MSLLDAIGISAPEETKRTRKEQVAAPEAATRPIRKNPDKPEAETTEAAVETGPAAQTDGGRETATEAAAAVPVPDATENMGRLPQGSIPLDKHLCFALYSANHAMHGVYKALLKEVGLTYPQFLAMTVLWETNNVPVGAITTKLQLDTNTLTPLLKRLEAMGLVTRTRNVKDERQVILKLTRKGRALEKKTAHFGACVFSATGLQVDEILDLQSKIMKLRDNLRQAELGSAAH